MIKWNIGNVKGRFFHGIIFIICALVTFAMMAGPAAAESIQDHPQLQQELMKRYQAQDRERIVHMYNRNLSAGIPSETMTPVIENGVRAGMDAGHLELMLREMYRARESGLPTGPVAAKAMEGMVKHVGGPQIIQAMETVRQRMQFSAGQVDHLRAHGFSENQRKQMIIDTTEAMASGMDEAHIRKVFDDLEKGNPEGPSGNESREQVMTTIRAMKRFGGYGISADHTVGVCGQMIDHQYTWKEIKDTMDVFHMARSRSWNMDETAESVENYISNGGRGNEMMRMFYSASSGSGRHGSGSMGSSGGMSSGGGMNGGHGGMGGGGGMH